MFTITQATRNDIPVLTHIIREANIPVARELGLTPDNAAKHPSNCTDDWIESAFEKGIVYYLLASDNHPCGCVALEQAGPDVGYLERLAVLPDYQKRGFGEALVRHLFSEAAARKIRRVEIGTIAEHTELTAWYQKLGFVETRTKAFEHLPFTVKFMAKTL